MTSDVQAPTLTSASLNSTDLDPSAPGGAFLAGSISFSDLSGLEYIILSYQSTTSDQRVSLYFGLGDAIDGNALAGTIQSSRELDQFTANGQWTLSSLSTRDQAGNGFDLYRDDFPTDAIWFEQLDALNIDQSALSFVVNNTTQEALRPEDTSTPIINSLSLSSDRLDPSQPGGASLTVNVDFTDQGSGLDDVFLTFESVETGQQIYFDLGRDDFIQGSLLSGTVTESREINAFAASGEWKLTQIYGRDQASNSFSFSRSNFSSGAQWDQFLIDSNIQSTFVIDRSDALQPNYALTATAQALQEGNSLTATVNTTNLEEGTTLYWQFSGDSIEASDLDPSSLSGSGVVDANGQLSFDVTIADDQQAEGNETLKIQLYSDSSLTTPVGNALSIAINDPESGSTDNDANGLVDNRSVYTLFNGGDPLTITKERSDGSTRSFSTTGIPNWDATQAVQATDGSGFNVLLEGADGTARADQFLVWTTDNTGLISSSTGWKSADQLAQDGWETVFGDIFSSGGIEDTTPPDLLSYTLSDYNIDLSDGDVTVDVTAAIRDDISGVFDGTFANGDGGGISFARWTSPSGNQFVSGGGFTDPVTGDFLNGTYNDQAVFNQFSENGTWTLDNFFVVDEVGNSTFLSSDQLNELGIQTTLEVIGGMGNLTPNSTDLLT